VRLKDATVGVWCAMSATRIVAPIFLTINGHSCVTHILVPFVLSWCNF